MGQFDVRRQSSYRSAMTRSRQSHVSQNGHRRRTGGSGSTGSGSSYAVVQQLPEFPSCAEFAYNQCNKTTPAVPVDKFYTLVTMYRAHSQRILDSVNKFNFTEIPFLLTHFWREIPSHISPYLGQDPVVSLIGICDSILYRTVLRAVLPSPAQVLPDSVLKTIRKFTDDLITSMHTSLAHLPPNLIYIKLKLGTQLSKCLKRRTSVNHLYQASNLILSPSNPDIHQCMLEEWKAINVCRIIGEVKYCSTESLRLSFESFQYMLERKACMADICEWINDLIERHLTSRIAPNSSANAGAGGLVGAAKKFLETWSTVSNGIFRELCDSQGHRHSSNGEAKSSLRLLQVMTNEYVLHEVECLICDGSMRDMMFNMMNGVNPTDLPDTSFVEAFGPDFLTASSPAASAENCADESRNHSRQNETTTVMPSSPNDVDPLETRNPNFGGVQQSDRHNIKSEHQACHQSGGMSSLETHRSPNLDHNERTLVIDERETDEC